VPLHNRRGRINAVLLGFASLLTGFTLHAQAAQSISLENGALVYQTRCTLCHGNFGLGEGPLAYSLNQYPDTNLAVNRHGKDAKSIRNIILRGGSGKDVNKYMPPWGDELTHNEVESVTKFLVLFHSDNEKANRLLNVARQNSPVTPKKTLGMAVFLGRCAMCHGGTGEGNGRLASRLQTPPANLVKSRLNEEQLELIIRRGGKAVGRSFQMPPWGEELSSSEIKSIVMFLKSIR
jgi:cbb3-type cytochrome c oxidase subunit III